MTPAQRHSRLRKYKRKKNKTSRKFNRFFFVPVVVVISIFAAYFFGRRNCIAGLKSSLVVARDNGDVIVSVFDSKSKEVSSIIIPGSTQLSVSRQLGSWKTKSIWQLGINEKYEGRLLQETIVKNFHFPVNMWVSEQGYGFVSGNFLAILKALFFPYRSNLSFGDRISLFFASFGIENEKVSVYDLSKVGVLKKTRLTDGEDGFLVTKEVPIYILAAFSELINKKVEYKVMIINATGERKIAENIGKTIEVMGAKVTSIKEEEIGEYDCYVSGKDRNFAKKLSQIYSCGLNKHKDSDFDIVFGAGEKFAKRF